MPGSCTLVILFSSKILSHSPMPTEGNSVLYPGSSLTHYMPFHIKSLKSCWFYCVKCLTVWTWLKSLPQTQLHGIQYINNNYWLIWLNATQCPCPCSLYYRVIGVKVTTAPGNSDQHTNIHVKICKVILIFFMNYFLHILYKLCIVILIMYIN